jgi:hypothetical protein
MAEGLAAQFNATNGTCVVVTTQGTLYCACAVLLLIAACWWRAWQRLWSRLEILEASENQRAVDMSNFVSHIMSEFKALKQQTQVAASSSEKFLGNFDKSKPTCFVVESSAKSKTKSQDTLYWLSRAAQVSGITVPWWLRAAATGAGGATD